MMPSQSFFARLPYDVREIVYKYLEPGAVPPFTPGFQASTSGFMLSCRRAKQELDDLAAIQFTKYLANFKTTFEQLSCLRIEVPANRTTIAISQLRHITIALPFTAFQPLTVQDWRWERDVLAGLHPLFAQFFDKVHINFCGEENKPPHQSVQNRGHVEMKMHSLLRDITYMIERVNSARTGQDSGINRSFSVNQILPYTPGREHAPYPSARVNTKRICLSWDLNPEKGQTKSVQDEVALNGKMHRDALEEGLDAVDMATVPAFYHVRDADRMIGEMGIASTSRWTSTCRINFPRLLNGVHTHTVYCSSEGLGKDIAEGLIGVDEAEFEDCELDVSRHLFGQ